MRISTSILVCGVLVSQIYAAPQLISFKDGKLGVNFGGYHAGVGIGGGDGVAGGLYAEAGTPHGQSARAGLGGSVGEGGPAGGLYAGATAGGNVKAEAGLSGSVAGEKSSGVGFANAQAGDRFASSGLGGESSVSGSHGYKYSGVEVLKETEVQPPVQPIEINKPLYKKVHKEFKLDAANEVQPEVHEVHVPPPPPPPTVFKEVVYQPAVVEKHYIRTKPRHHFRKTAYVGGYFGGNAGAEVPPPPPPPAVVYKAPVLQKRIDVAADRAAEVDAHASGAAQVSTGYTKQIQFQRNPTFFADIFNIPIQTLKAVGSFLGNTAGSTGFSVQKSATVQKDTDGISSKYISPSSSSSAVSSDAEISFQTPTASKFIDDIFAIPINTLGAVNKFLENNVPARKQVTLEQTGEPTRVRLGPKARRRANKQVIYEYINESPEPSAANAEDVQH